MATYRQVIENALRGAIHHYYGPNSDYIWGGSTASQFEEALDQLMACADLDADCPNEDDNEED